MSRRALPATALAGAWTAALVVLAVLWVRSPYTGPGYMFVLWSAVALPLTVLSWLRFRSWRVRQVPRSTTFLATTILFWTAVAVLSASGVGAEMALDALIMRETGMRSLGKALEWLPGVWGALLSVGGLAAALEARYRLAHGEAGRTPPP